jgi:hypothetical protein
LDEKRETLMGLADDAKDTAEAAFTKVERTVEDGVDRLKDKGDEVKADAKVRGAEAERESVARKNEAKENLRDS